MKKFIRILYCMFVVSVLLSLSIMIGGCSKDIKDDSGEPLNKSIIFNDKSVSISLMDSVVLEPIVNNISETLVWSSEDNSIVSVDSIGKITGLKEGSTKITVKAGEIFADIKVIVLSEGLLPEIILDNDDIKIFVTDTYQITPIIRFNNKDYLDGTFSYSTTDDNIIKVTEQGKIEAVGMGEANILIKGEWRGMDTNAMMRELHVLVKPNMDITLALPSDIYVTNTNIDGVEYKNEVKPTIVLYNREEIETPKKDYIIDIGDKNILEYNIDKKTIVGKSEGKTTLQVKYELDNGFLVTSNILDINVEYPTKTSDAPIDLELANNQLNDGIKDIAEGEILKIIDISTDETFEVYKKDSGILKDKVVFGNRKWKLYNKDFAVVCNVTAMTKIINTQEDFLKIYEYMKTDEKGVYDGYVVLGNDIDLSQKIDYKKRWATGMCPFNYDNLANDWGVLESYKGLVGTFDGRGHTVKGLQVATFGLFNNIASTGVVKNVAFTDVRFDGTDAAVFARHNNGTIDNVFISISDTKHGSGNTGGFCQFVNAGGNVTNCVVKFNTKFNENAGAICFRYLPSGNISNVYTITDDDSVIVQWKGGIFNEAKELTFNNKEAFVSTLTKDNLSSKGFGDYSQTLYDSFLSSLK